MDHRRRAAELQREKRDREKRRTSIFNEVLSKLYSRINNRAALNWTRMVYEVPQYVVGMPFFELPACIAHVSKHLRADGYLVEVYEPNMMYISWDRKELTAAAPPPSAATWSF